MAVLHGGRSWGDQSAHCFEWADIQQDLKSLQEIVVEENDKSLIEGFSNHGDGYPSRGSGNTGRYKFV